jgi:hypothetical protein
MTVLIQLRQRCKGRAACSKARSTLATLPCRPSCRSPADCVVRDWADKEPVGEFGFDVTLNFNPLSPFAKSALRSLAGPNAYEFVDSDPLAYCDPNGLWVTRYPEPLRGTIGGGISGIFSILGGLAMGHCPDLTCHRSTCKACCWGGFAAATGGNIGGAAVGCGGTLGVGCWINIGVAVLGEAALADSLHQCLSACQSKSL